MTMEGQIEFRVRYAETDAMGVVHHANYYVWFEMGRTEILRDMGLEYKKMEEGGLFSPVIETQCQYKMPAKYDDLIRLETKLIEVDRIRWTFGYQVLRDNQLLAQGKTRHCFINEAGRPLAIKKAHPELYHALVEAGLVEK